MPGNAGFNITGQGLSGDNVLGYLVNEFRAQTATVINEAKMAEALASRMPYAVFRLKGEGNLNDDSAYSNHADAGAFADMLCNSVPPGCMVYAGNEFGSSNLKLQDDWTNRFVERCAARGYRPLVHNQFTQHPVSGVVGWRQLASSTRAAMQAGGGVGAHVYWRTTPSGERALPYRNGYSNLAELRQVFGQDLLIISSEYAFDEDFGKGYQGRIDDLDYAAQLIEGAEIAWNEYHAFVQWYGFFPPGSQWESFNLWFNERIKPILAAWNRNATLEDTPMPDIPVSIDVPLPTEGGVPATLTRIPARYVNLRAQPSISGADAGDLHVGEAFTIYPVALEGDWLYVMRTSDSAAGWVSLQGSKVVITLKDEPAIFRLVSPLLNGVITAHFGEPRDYGRHEGIDFALAPNPCAIGDVWVTACADGVVESVRSFQTARALGKALTNYGVYVRLRHVVGADTFYTWYGHLSAELVCVGEQVEAGQPIGILGTTGNSTGYHVHLTLQHIGQGLKGYAVDDVVDPLLYLDQ